MIALAPVLTPHGALVLIQAGDGVVLDGDRSARLERAFARGSGHGLLSLAVWMTRGRSCRRHYPGGGISELGSPPPSAPRAAGTEEGAAIRTPSPIPRNWRSSADLRR